MTRPRIILADDHPMSAEAFANLFAADYDVLSLVPNGRDLVDVARILDMSPRTVAFHKYRIMTELQAKADVELDHFPIKNNIVALWGHLSKKSDRPVTSDSRSQAPGDVRHASMSDCTRKIESRQKFGIENPRAGTRALARALLSLGAQTENGMTKECLGLEAIAPFEFFKEIPDDPSRY